MSDLTHQQTGNPVAAVGSYYPWHHSAWQQIVSQQRRDRLAHAYLFTGLPDTGRHQFVLGVAHYVLCEADKITHSKACGRCRQCLLFAKGYHPDVLQVKPEEGSRAIKIDQVRQIADHVQQTSNQASATKVIIIQPAEALGTAAANSLLKSLEEPPGKALFLLIADSGDSLLATIRSRCQNVALPSPTFSDTQAWLATMSAADSDTLASAAALAPRQPFAALRMLEEGVPAWREILTDKLISLRNGEESVTEVARFCEKQPVAHAINLMTDLCTEQVRSLAVEPQSRTSARIRQLLKLQREIYRVSAQQESTSNPNLLMSLEYLLSQWQELSPGR
ncbi:DNA polymerase III subunit delta' [Pseudohongiella sp. SYSU M77423]|uniref:DNA polymerase III subunit delta' n=1 Tax=unclassified Pseudohongiella TaxID=2629611 RepID=UPI001F02A965|nr:MULTISPECIES: DNA polymerase III subunit delta' [unclassified Pseudohongiella]MDH7943140.1 DNA polymerase III subunit delta' [Pseudohongiella sp. SYSU M77423]